MQKTTAFHTIYQTARVAIFIMAYLSPTNFFVSVVRPNPASRGIIQRKWHLLVTMLLLLLLSRAVSAAGEQSQAPLSRVRLEIFASNYAKARALLTEQIAGLPEGEQKDVCRVLYGAISGMGESRRGSRADRAQQPVDPGQPQSQTPAVKAEMARANCFQLAMKAKRLEAIDAFNAFLKNYPDQVSSIDLYNFIQVLNAEKYAKEVANVVKLGETRFANDPVFKLAKTLPLHWTQNAPEGVAISRAVEAEAAEPVLSVARIRELNFLNGDFDNPKRIDESKETARKLIASAQVDLSSFMGPFISSLLTRANPAAGAEFLTEALGETKNPAVADYLREAAVREYIHIGRQDEARRLVDSWKQAVSTDAEKASFGLLENLIAAAVCRIEGKVPAGMLEGGKGWRVSAVPPPLNSTTEGMIVLQNSVDVGPDGSFSVDAGGKKISALLLSGHDASGKFIVKELGRGLKDDAGQSVSYPNGLILPPTAPAQTARTDNPYDFVMADPFGSGEPWPEQLVEFTVSRPKEFDPKKVRVTQEGNMVSGSSSIPCQVLEVKDKTVKIGVWRGLKSGEQVKLHLLFDGAIAEAPVNGKISTDSGNDFTIVNTGPAQFRIAKSTNSVSDPARVAFLQSVKGADNAWHGAMQWSGSAAPTKVTVVPVLQGPIRTSFRYDYTFANGATRQVTLSFDAGQSYVLIDENGTGSTPGQWRWLFSSEEGFHQVFTAIRPAHSVEPLVNRTPRFRASIRDYAYFQGGNGSCIFVGMTADNKKDAVTLFDVHPGDWIDPTNPNMAPLDDAPDEQWIHPDRYLGSPNSLITTTVVKDGEMPWTISLAPGTRRWGVAVTDQSAPDPVQTRNPAADWAIQRVVHAFNRGDLNRYLSMKLDWPAGEQGKVRDTIAARLPQLREDVKKPGLYAKTRKAMQDDWLHIGGSVQMDLGVEDEDPAVVWLGWRNSLQRLRNYAKGCISLETSKDGDYLNAVGTRSYTTGLMGYAMAEDLGLVSEAERQEVRRCAAILAYRFWNADWMNYNTNAGQPNFEADRLLQLSAFPAFFPDHPDSRAITEHVVKYTDELLRHWTIRAGGKWAENIGAYYLHSFSCVQMTILLLDSLGKAQPVLDSPYFEPFCRFAQNTVQIPQPKDSSWLKKDEIIKEPFPMERRTPGMGSHGGEGGSRAACTRVLMAQLVEKTMPKLAVDLTALWQSSGEDVSQNFCEMAERLLYFGKNEYAQQKLELFPIRLPGWGAVMRDAVGTDKEFYLAFRAGTAAYRDMNYGGCFVFGALGVPLSLDGGDTWDCDQRSTILLDLGSGRFAPVPLGKVTRWLVSDAVEYARGEFRRTPADPDYFSRDILFVRNDYVIVHDEAHSRLPGIFNLCTPALKATQTDKGVLCQGKLGVDLWITQLAEQPSTASTIETRYGDERVTVPNQWKQFAVRLPFPDGKESTVVLYPVKSGGAAPEIRKLAEGVWQIKGAGFEDVLFQKNGAANIQGAGMISLKGQFGLWRSAGQGRTASFSLLNGDSVEVGKETADSTEAITFEVGNGHLHKTGAAH